MSRRCFSAAVTAGDVRRGDSVTRMPGLDISRMARRCRCRGGLTYVAFTQISPIIERIDRLRSILSSHYQRVNQMRQSVQTIAIVVAAILVTLGLSESANAGVISTEAAIEMQERSARIERINSVLARDSVQSQMIRLGVQPDVAAARIASLSDSELQQLEARMDELPAGADSALTVLGIVLLVLLVLELVGVTDVFKSF